MDKFKETNMNLATSLDYNASCKRIKGSGKLIRRYARRKLKRELKKEV